MGWRDAPPVGSMTGPAWARAPAAGDLQSPSGGTVATFDPRPASDRGRSFAPYQRACGTGSRKSRPTRSTIRRRAQSRIGRPASCPGPRTIRRAGDNSQAAQQARAHARVVQTERDYREQYAGRTADDPWRRPDGTALGNAARFGADALGMFGGGAISDPTNAIAPGRNRSS
jgi:hypothetical protein